MNLKRPVLSPMFVLTISVVLPIVSALILQTWYMSKLTMMGIKLVGSSCGQVTTVTVPTVEPTVAPSASPSAKKVIKDTVTTVVPEV